MNQIFKELGAMVHEQGEVIDSIEASVEKTEVFVGEGTNQLRQASNYQVTKLYLVCGQWNLFLLCHISVLNSQCCIILVPSQGIAAGTKFGEVRKTSCSVIF